YSRSNRRARDRHSRRAARKRHPHSLSNRRYSSRSGSPAAIAPPSFRNHLALESDVAHGHRGAALAAGRPHEFAGERIRDRRPRFDNSNRERRIDQFAIAQPRRPTFWVRAFGFEQETGEIDSSSPRATERNHLAHRSDRLRKIDVVVLLFEHDQFRVAPHHH